MDAAHPFRVAARQVIVNCNNVNALSFKRVEITGQSGHQRFAFARLHFRDFAAMKNNAANQAARRNAAYSGCAGWLHGKRQKLQSECHQERAPLATRCLNSTVFAASS